MHAKSESTRSLPLALAAIGFAFGCGGQTVGEHDGGSQQDAAESVGVLDAAGSAETVAGGSPDSAPTVDAAPSTAHDAASTPCNQTGGGGGGGNGTCTSTFGETCGGTNYQVSCSCPRGSCVCFGQSTTVVNFTGCPSCPGLGSSFATDDIFALCGFPR
jgi:hypothetical protein